MTLAKFLLVLLLPGLLLLMERMECHPPTSNSLVFSSPGQLRQLRNLEKQLAGLLTDYVRETENQMAVIKTYLHEISSVLYSNSQGSRDIFDPTSESSASSDSVLDPLQAFHTIRRLAVDWGQIQDTLERNLQTKRVLHTAHTEANLFPTEQDLHGAALALVRLQDTYDLNVTEIAQGYIQGIQSDTVLNARDCMYLGKHSFNNGFYGHSIRWFDEALKLSDSEEIQPERVTTISGTVSPQEILSFRKTALEVYDEHVKYGGIEDIPSQFRLSEVGSNADDQLNFHELCKGKKLLSLEEQSKLTCYYSARGEAYLTLQPVKVEVHHLNPTVLQFHDLITAKEAEQVKAIAQPKLSKSMVQGLGVLKNVESNERISQTAWLHQNEQNKNNIIDRLNLRVQMVTGLSANSKEEHIEALQVAQYGIGGFYQPHFDYLMVDKTAEEKSLLDPLEIRIGDRTGTLMFYLSDVTRGGATAFPRMGISVWPKKYSAVFWYNLKLNGEGESLTLHGGCPVLYGQKWVGNYWFREIGQTFRRRCSLEKEL